MSVSEKRDWYDKNCNKGTRRMFRNIYGLDLGTYEIKIYDKRRDRIRSAKNVIAIRDEKDIFAVGNAAYAMYEKAPENIQVVFPMHHGVIARFHEMQYLLCALLKREGRYPNGAEYVIAAPTDVTEVEKKAFYDLVHHSAARAKTVRIVDRAIADAVGMGLDVFSAKGVFVVNFGGETTELSVLSGGKTVLSRLLPVGGAALDEAIVASVRHNKEFLIGRTTAEQMAVRYFKKHKPQEADSGGKRSGNGSSRGQADLGWSGSGCNERFSFGDCKSDPVHDRAYTAGCPE